MRWSPAVTVACSLPTGGSAGDDTVGVLGDGGGWRHSDRRCTEPTATRHTVARGTQRTPSMGTCVSSHGRCSLDMPPSRGIGGKVPRACRELVGSSAEEHVGDVMCRCETCQFSQGGTHACRCCAAPLRLRRRLLTPRRRRLRPRRRRCLFGCVPLALSATLSYALFTAAARNAAPLCFSRDALADAPLRPFAAAAVTVAAAVAAVASPTP